MTSWAIFSRIFFFVNAGVRFIEEHAKLARWASSGRSSAGALRRADKQLRFVRRAGQLWASPSPSREQRPAHRLEALAVTLGRDARARAVQLPAWNEALGLPRPWDQQWALRIQQVLAFETDILEYPDIFEGSVVMEGLVDELLAGARAEMAVVAEHGGAVAGVDYMKAALVDSHRARLQRIEAGEQIVVGLNKYTETEESPLTSDAAGGIMVVDQAVEAHAKEAIATWRADRDREAVDAALTELARVARTDENIMPASIAAAQAGVTTGEWSATLRAVFGEYRAPPAWASRRRSSAPPTRSRRCARRSIA